MDGPRTRAGLRAWCVGLLYGGAVLLLAGATGCDTARTAVPGYPASAAEFSPTAAQCRACHGNGENAAPPRGAHGQTSTTDRGVGAHQTHVRADGTHVALACEVCHVVPKTISDHGHIDDQNFHATVQFTGLALANGATATYDDKNLTCAVYCHGSTLKAPGLHSKPVWTQVDGQQRSCNSCHGAPPPAPHPTATDCAGCHAATAGPGLSILHPEKHIDGHVDVVLAPTVSCTGCHAQPPTTGNHPKLWVDDCSKCHAATVDAGQHLIVGGKHADGQVQVALASKSCDACHGAPPADVGPEHKPHPKMNRCEKCHTTTVDSAGQIIPNGGHLNGKVDLQLPTSCEACHGAPGSGGAPAPDHNGNTDPSLPGVGAHAAHLKGKTFSKGGIACTTCHVLPATVDAPGHMYGESTIVLDKVSTWRGKATFDQPSQSCAATACHGGGMEGGSVPKPKWTMTTLACDACHGIPPALVTGHVQTDPAKGTQACAACHKKTIKPDGSLDLEGGYHVNGWVDP